MHSTVTDHLACDAECDHTDLIELSVGAEHERQDMKHFDPYHSSRLVPVSRMTAKTDAYCKSKTTLFKTKKKNMSDDNCD